MQDDSSPNTTVITPDANAVPVQTFGPGTAQATTTQISADATLVKNAEDMLRRVSTNTEESLSGDSSSEALSPRSTHYSSGRLFGHKIGHIFIFSLVVIISLIGMAVAGVRIFNHDSQGNAPSNFGPVSGLTGSDKNQQQQALNNSVLRFNRDVLVGDGKTLSTTGDVLVQSSVNSPTAFRIQNASGNNLLVANTVNSTVTINGTVVNTGNLTVGGALASSNNAFALSGQGLTIGGVLVCTAAGCVGVNQQTIDVTNLASLTANQTFTGINRFTAGGNVFVGNGSGLGALNASNLASGTVNDSRLSNNVALLDHNQTFSGNNTFNNLIQASGGVNAASYSVNGAPGSTFTCSPGDLLQQPTIQSGIITGGMCVPGGGASIATLQQSYDASVPATIILSAASGPISLQDAATPLGTNLFQVTSNSGATKYFAVTSSGVTITGNVNISGVYQVAGVQISSANLSNDGNLAKLNANQTFTGNNTFSAAGNSFTGSGAGLTSLNASNVSSGTLNDARLSANVALLSGTGPQTFTGNNKFTGTFLAQNASNSTTAFVIQNTLGSSNLFVADTTNTRIGIGKAPTLGSLDVNGNIFQNGNQVCDTSGNCTGVTGIGGSGTVGTIPVFTGSGTTVGDSLLSQSGNTVTANGNLNLSAGHTFQVNGSQISSANLSNDANLAKLNGNQTFTGTNTFSSTTSFNSDIAQVDDSTQAFNIQDSTADPIFNVDTTNQVISINGGTVGSFALQVGGDVSVNGGYFIGNRAIDSNDLADAANIARLNANQSFTGTNTFAKTSATALQVQNSGSAETLLTVNTNTRTSGVAGNVVTIGNATGTDTNTTILVLDSASGVPTTNLASLNGGMFYNTSTNHFNVIESGLVKELCNKTDLGCGSAGAAQTLAVVYANGASQTDETIALDSTRNGVLIRDNATPIGGTLFGVQNSTGATKYLDVTSSGISVAGTIVATGNINSSGGGLQTNSTTRVDNSGNLTNIGNFTSSGATTFSTTGANGFTFKPGSDTATAFQIQNAGGSTNMFVVDTQNTKIGLGAAPTSTGTLIQFGNGDVSFTQGVGNHAITGARGNPANDGADLRLYGGSGGTGVTSPGNLVLGYTGSAVQGKVAVGQNASVGGALLQVGGDVNFKNASNSATAFQIQNSGAADTLLSVDTTTRGASGGNLIKIGNSTGTDGNTTILVVDSATSAPTSNLGALNGGLFYNSTTNHVNVIENGSVKELCNKTDLGCGSAGATQTLALVYANGSNQTDETILLDSTRNGVLVRDNATPITGTLFGVQNSTGGTKYLDVTSAGISVAGTVVATGDINTSGGSLQTNSTTRLDNSGNLTNINNADLTGSLATKKGTDYSTTGTSNNVNFSNASLVRLTGASTQTITGIANGRDGYLFTLLNAASQSAVLTNNDASSSAANRITTGTGGSISIAPGSSLILVYDSAASLWRVVGDVAGGSGSGVTTVGTLDSQAKSADGAVIAGSSIVLQTADASFAGLVSTGAQTFAGDKTLTGATLLKNASNSATAFQIQNSGAADTLFTANTNTRTSGAAGNVITIGNATGTDTNTTILVLDSATSAPTTNLSSLNGGLFYNSTSNHVNVIENGSVKELCNKTDLGCGSAGTTPTLANVYANGTSQTDETILLDSTRNGVLIRDNATPIGVTLFGVQNSTGATKYLDVTTAGISVAGTIVASGDINTTGGSIQTNSTTRIDNSGNLTNIGNLTTTGASTFSTTGANGFTFKPGTDNALAFQVQNAASSAAMLVVDTSTSRVGINTNSETLAYDLSFGQASDRTIGVLTRTTNNAGSKLTIQAGNAGAGATGVAGGALVLQGGSAAGTTGNANGGDVTIYGGAKVNSGNNGNVVLAYTGSATQGEVLIGASTASFSGLTAGGLGVNGDLMFGSATSHTINVAPGNTAGGNLTIAGGVGGTTNGGTVTINGGFGNGPGINANVFIQSGSSSGEVGIGTTTPSAKLHVNSDKNGEALFKVTDGTATAADVLTIADEGATTFKNRTNSSTAFQIQNSGAADTLFTADTTARGAGGGNLVKIGNSTGTDGNTTILVVDSATANPTSNLSALSGGLFYNSTTNHINVIENGSVKELCNRTDLGCGSAGATQTLATVYANGSSQTDETILLDSTRNGVLIRDNATPIGGTLFGVQNSTGGTKYLDVTATGISVAGTVTATGNINSSGGAIQTNGTTRIDNSGNLSNIGNVSLSGTISGGTSITGSGNINSTGGGLQTNSTTRVDNSGNLTNINNLDVSGSAAFKKGTDFSTTGTSNDVNFSNASVVRLTGASAQTLTGIANGRDGYLLTLINAGSANATIANNSGSSSAANRITTGTGGSISVAVGSSLTLVYDSGASLWRVIGDVAGGAGAGVTTIGALDAQSPSADGATIVGNSIYLQSASDTSAGLINTTAQTFAGDKTFKGLVITDPQTQGCTGSLPITVGASPGQYVACGNGDTVTNPRHGQFIAFDAGNSDYTIYESDKLISTAGYSIQAADTLNLLTQSNAGAFTNSVIINTGNVTSGAFASGNIGLDVGSSTGTTGSISIGGANASSVTIGNSSNVTIGGTVGGISLGGSTLLGPGKNLTFSSGAGNFDQSASSGTFATGTGAVSLNGDTTIAGSHTFTTGTSAVALNGDTTIANGKNLTAGGAALFKDNTNSSTAFQIQNSGAADTLFTANTNTRTGGAAGNVITIGNATGTDTNTTILVLDSASAVPTTNLSSLNGGLFYNTATNHVNVVENGAVKELCNKTDLACGSAAPSTTLEGAYANGSSQTDGTILLDSTRNGVLVRDNATPLGSTLFGVQNSTGGTKYLDVTATGISVAGTSVASGNINSTGGSIQTNSVTRLDNSGNLTNIGNLTTSGASTFSTTGANGFTFKPGTDNAAAFRIQNAAGSATILNADTTNNRISIGTNGTATGQLYVSGSLPSGSLNNLTTGTGTPQHVVVQGNYAYVTTNATGPNGVLRVYDASNPSSLTFINSVTVGSNTTTGLAVQGRYAYVSLSGDDKMQVVDISNPNAPTNKGSATTASGAATYLAAQGKYVYALSSSGSELDVFDVGNPSAPSRVASLSIGANGNGLYVQGRYAYVALNGATPGLRIIDINDPTNPVSASTSSTTDTPTAISVAGRYVYLVSSASNSLRIFDAKTPNVNNATNVGTLTLTANGSPNSIYIQGHYAYISSGGTANTVQVVDIDDPTNPQSVGTIPAGASTNDVYISGRYAYTVDTGANLRSYDVGGSYIQQLRAGGIATTTLTTQELLVTNNTAINGGLSVGGASQFNGNVSIAPTANSTSSFQVQNAAGAALLNVSTSGNSITLKSPTNSTSFLQAQNSNGESLFNIDSTSVDLVTNGSFESNTTGWAGLNTGTINRITTDAIYGSASADVVVVAANDGAKYPITLSTNTTYSATFYINITAGSANGWQVGYNNGSTNTTSSICTISSTSSWTFCSLSFTTPATNTGTPFFFIWHTPSAGADAHIDGVELEANSNGQPYKASTLTLNTVIKGPLTVQNTADSTAALQVLNASGGNQVFVVDSSGSHVGINKGPGAALTAALDVGGTGKFAGSLQENGGSFLIQNTTANTTSTLVNIDTSNNVNLLPNGSVEGSGTGFGWANRGASATAAQDSTQFWQGNNSLSITTTTTSGTGAKYGQFAFGTTTQYTLSFYGKVASGSISDIQFGREDSAAGGEINCASSQTFTTTWTRFSCTFTTAGTVDTNVNYVYVEKSGGSAETFYIDGVQLQTGSTLTPFNSGGEIQLEGIINSPLVLQNRSDSAAAFQIQNAAGTSNTFMVDTTNTRIGIGTGTLNQTLNVAGTSFFQTTTNSSNAFQLQNSVSANVININDNGSNLAANSGAETAFGTEWAAFGTATVSRDVVGSEVQSGVASAKAVTTAINSGMKNVLSSTLSQSTTYMISFTIKGNTGASDLAAAILYNGTTIDTGTGAVNGCGTTMSITTTFAKVSCSFTTGSSNTFTSSNALAIYETTTGRTFFVDNLAVFAQTTGSLNTHQIQIGGVSGQGLTLLTVDSYSGRPTTNGSINSALYGSMYYDTTLGKMQCYEATGWGYCGASPDVSVNIIPEYTNAVLDGGGIGTLTSDLCANTGAFTGGSAINSSLCSSGQLFNYYSWNTIQSTSQSYSLYVRYQLPATYKSIDSNNPVSLYTRSTDVTGSDGVTFSMYDNTGAQCGSTQTLAAANAWTQLQIASLTGCTLAANTIVLFKITVTATNGSTAYASNLSFVAKGQ
jgi:hypothetical protein